MKRRSFDSTIHLIQKHIDNGNKTLALRALAYHIGDERLYRAFHYMNELHKTLKSLPPGLHGVRYSLMQETFKLCRNILEDEEYLKVKILFRL